ncbi:MAG: hypothetical protein ACO3UM_10315, partial [Planctomycetota bacterium]
MRRALRAIEGVLAELPLAPEVLEARIDEALGSLSVEEGLADLRETLVCETASRLGDHLEGLRDALSPVPAPRDADWAGSALESLGVDQDVVRSWARPSRAPGWLWARIRRDMEEARTAVRARRVPVALAAAPVVLSAALAVVRR